MRLITIHPITRLNKSSKLHSVPVTFAAIAGVIRNVLCRRQKL
jgi:Co/Zn/Cd efflux system component